MPSRVPARALLWWLLAFGAATMGTTSMPAQQPPAGATPPDTVKIAPEDTAELWGAVDPGRGFMVAKTDRGTLSISAYALWRYLNQLPPDQTYTDHLGNEQTVKTRNDFQLHRVMVNLLGWVYTPKFRYVVLFWTVNTTAQNVAIVGSVSYAFSQKFTLVGGVNALPGTRTMLGSHPYWLGNDRVMSDEFFKPGFTSGVYATGELFDGFHYLAMAGNSLNQIGLNAVQSTRTMATGASVWWMPSTGEFGPRGAYGDFESHDKLATRIGISTTHSRENRLNQIGTPSPDNTQIRLSDGLLLFATGSLAPGVTVTDATYQLLSTDAGLKYRGFFLQTEFEFRRIDDFVADGPLPLSVMRDWGFYVQSGYMVKPKKLELYAATSQIYGQFNHPWEVLGGANAYVNETRNLRLNLQVIYVDRSPVNSVFGYYTGGQKGPTISFATMVLF